MQQQNEREDQWEGTQDSDKTGTAMMYGAETWALKQAQEKKLEVADMITL